MNKVEIQYLEYIRFHLLILFTKLHFCKLSPKSFFLDLIENKYQWYWDISKEIHRLNGEQYYYNFSEKNINKKIMDSESLEAVMLEYSYIIQYLKRLDRNINDETQKLLNNLLDELIENKKQLENYLLSQSLNL